MKNNKLQIPRITPKTCNGGLCDRHTMNADGLCNVCKKADKELAIILKKK